MTFPIDDLIYKKLFNKLHTNDINDHPDEPFRTEEFVFQKDIIPDNIPAQCPLDFTYPDGSTIDFVQVKIKLQLTPYSDRVFYHTSLKQCIPFTFDTQNYSYNYQLFKSDGITEIQQGEGNWYVDCYSGVLVFYGDMPSDVDQYNPPMISFYKFTGVPGTLGDLTTTGSINQKNMYQQDIVTKNVTNSTISLNIEMSASCSVISDIDVYISDTVNNNMSYFMYKLKIWSDSGSLIDNVVIDSITSSNINITGVGTDTLSIDYTNTTSNLQEVVFMCKTIKLTASTFTVS